MKKTSTEKERDFIQGFMSASGIGDRREAAEQWACFARQLSDGELTRIERRGFASGVREGKSFRELYPIEEEEEETP